MTPDTILQPLPVRAWHGPFEPALSRQATDALEAGRVLLLPLPFATAEDERDLLDESSASGTRKNISLDPQTGRLGSSAVSDSDQARMAAMMRRFAESAVSLMADLLPDYAPRLERARTSFRPAEIAGRSYTLRHDDRLLHVDAFPSRPLRGRRILRLFTNIAPDGVDREWRVGEPFADYAGRFLPRVRRAVPGSGWAMQIAGLTKGRRSTYDHIMLGLHDAGKRDTIYQSNAPAAAVQFRPGTTWLCFTDQVLHAAMAGHCALEQTFHLPVEAMAHPEQAPVRVLERLVGRPLT